MKLRVYNINIFSLGKSKLTYQMLSIYRCIYKFDFSYTKYNLISTVALYFFKNNNTIFGTLNNLGKLC